MSVLEHEIKMYVAIPKFKNFKIDNDKKLKKYLFKKLKLWNNKFRHLNKSSWKHNK